MTLGPPKGPPALLQALDDLVSADAASPGFAGKICLGVRSNDSLGWWVASFGTSATTAFVETPPEDADVLVGLGSGSAADFLGLPKDPQEPRFHLVSGDRSLFASFIDRYVM